MLRARSRVYYFYGYVTKEQRAALVRGTPVVVLVCAVLRPNANETRHGGPGSPRTPTHIEYTENIYTCMSKCDYECGYTALKDGYATVTRG